MPAPKTFSRHARRVCKFEVRSINEGTADAPMLGEGGVKVARVTGYASVFGKVDWYGDVVKPGAFTKTLIERPKVKVLWQHNPDCPIGAPVNMKEDGYGLFVEFDLNLEVEQGREARALLKQKAIDGISIGFETMKDEQDEQSGTRSILEVRLWEFSVVTFQAQEAAMVTDVRALNDKTAAAMNRYQKAQLGMRDLSGELKAGLSKKDFSTSVQKAEEVIEELLALRDLMETAAAETEEPGLAHSEDKEREERALLELQCDLAKM